MMPGCGYFADGRHLLARFRCRGVMLGEQNGFVAGNTYGDTYLKGHHLWRTWPWAVTPGVNATGDDGSAVVTAEALLSGKALRVTNTGATTMTVITAR